MNTKAHGFGTFKGVYIPNVLMMLGVILYLRLGYVTGQVGVSRMMLIIGVSLFIMVVTGFSITSIVTNTRVGSGGAYYIISRALGIELGAALGILMYMSQIISISMCTSGFALSLHELYPQFDVTAISVITVFILTLIAFISSDLTLKTQTLIYLLLAASLVSVFTGSMDHVAPAPEQSAVPRSLGFWQGFAIFFPAVTGIEAGMAMSGSLKDPSRSLAIGTLGALATCGLIYTALALFLAYKIPASRLAGDPLILQQFASVRQLIVLGIWGATLSSALGSLLGAPRMLQALAADKVLPQVFGRTYGRGAEPRLALLFSATTGLILLLTTEMDQIIPILTMVCLISYGILNFVAGFADFIHHPSWRPAFRTPWYVSFTGAMASLVVMLMVNAGATFASLALVATLYALVKRKKIRVGFEDLRETIFFYFARKALYRLSKSLQHAKNWHLNLLVFAPAPRARMDFVHLAAGLTHRSGVLTFSSFVPESWGHEYRLDASEKTLNDFFMKQRIPCLVEVNATASLHESMTSFIQSYGIGPLQPNTVALSHPSDADNTKALVAIVTAATLRQKNFLIFRGEQLAGEHGGVFSPATAGKPKQVDIWWNSDYRNSFSLMLYLAKVLLTTAAWRHARLVIKTAVFDPNSQANIEHYLQEFVTSRRLNADWQVILVPEGREALNLLVESSRTSELVLTGLKPPAVSDDHDGASYHAYYEKTAEKTKPLRNLVMVIASEEVAFKEVFYD